MQRTQAGGRQERRSAEPGREMVHPTVTIMCTGSGRGGGGGGGAWAIGGGVMGIHFQPMFYSLHYSQVYAGPCVCVLLKLPR